MKKFDVLILGAGAAGLACAARLTRSGYQCRILEARDRIGGRILTRPTSTSDFPLELGAEFIHGTPKETLQRLERSGHIFTDVSDNHLFSYGQGVKHELRELPGFFELMSKFIQKLRSPQSRKTGSRDRSIHKFLETHSFSTHERKLFARFVEGFHAADLEKIGEHELRSTEQTNDDTLGGVESFRIPQGYDTLVRLLKSESSENLDLRLNSRATSIFWKPGDVTVRVHESFRDSSETYKARRLVVTLPLGVLKSSDIEWNPRPRQLDKALDAMEMGSVVKLILSFDERFWEKLSEKPVTFLHSTEDIDFPTWWTFAPYRTPHLVAWQGGPRARATRDKDRAELVESALSSLAKISGLPQHKLQTRLRGVDYHSWDLDPFSRGAYSYVVVNGQKKWKRLKRPIENTIYFAGEAFADGSARGTVHGAIRSGEFAAEQILRNT